MAASSETVDAALLTKALLYFERKAPHFSISLFPKCSLNQVSAEGVGVPVTGFAGCPEMQVQPAHQSSPQASTRTAAAHALFIGLLQCFA